MTRARFLAEALADLPPAEIAVLLETLPQERYSEVLIALGSTPARLGQALSHTGARFLGNCLTGWAPSRVREIWPHLLLAPRARAVFLLSDGQISTLAAALEYLPPAPVAPPPLDPARHVRRAWLASLMSRPDRLAALGAAVSLGKTGSDAVDFAMEGSP